MRAVLRDRRRWGRGHPRLRGSAHAAAGDRRRQPGRDAVLANGRPELGRIPGRSAGTAVRVTHRGLLLARQERRTTDWSMLKAFVLCNGITDNPSNPDQKDLRGAGLSRIECTAPFPVKL